MDTEPIDLGVLAEVPEDQRLDVDEGPDAHATEGGLDDDLDDLYDDPGDVVDLARLLAEEAEGGPADDERVPGAAHAPDLTRGGLERGGGDLRWAAPYAGATNCTGIAAGGARALLAWALENYADSDGAVSLGIYNCRSVRGGSTKSLHGEGRAVDLGLPIGSDGKGMPVGRDIVDRMGGVGDAVGIQCVIFDREIWSAVSPSGRAYNGVHPHYDHLHIELTRSAAEHMTLATFRQRLGGGGGGGGTGIDVAPLDTGSATEPDEQEEDSMFCNEGDVNQTVEYWQRLLRALTFYEGALDGDFGPKTRAAVVAATADSDGSSLGPREAASIHRRVARID